MLNFWTKKKKEELNQLDSNWQVMNAYNNATPEQKSQIKQIAQNTASQNFTAEEYNKQARENWEADWNNAYRRDILWINDTPVETEAEKKRRLMSEYYKKRDEEYEKRKKENPETALPSYMETQKEQENQQKEQVQNLAETQKEQVEQTQKQQEQQATNPTNIPSTDTAQVVNGQLQAQIQNDKNIVNNSVPTDTAAKAAQTATQGNSGVDYNNWTVEGWKSRWGSKDELENAIEKKYNTIATWGDDWTLTATIGWEKFQWKIDQNWNPVKTSLWMANSADLAKNEVSKMIQTGSTTDEIQKYIHEHNLQEDPIIKNQLTKKFLDDYEKPIIQKYSGYSLKDLYEAVENWEIIPWTEVFNKLPQAEAFLKAKDSLAVINSKKKKDYTAYNAAIDVEKIADNHTNKFFDTSGVDSIAERFKNDEELKRYRNDIYQKQKEIVDIQNQISSIWDTVRMNMGNAPENLIQAEIARQTQSLTSQIIMKQNLMDWAAKMIDAKRSDFEVEMWFLKYKDWLKKEQYMSALDLYKYDRNRMDEFKKLEMQYKNQELAFNRQQKAQKEMYELQQKYKGWTYQVGVDWSLNYIVNWKAQKVQFDDGKTLFTKTRWDTNIVTKQNPDWSFSTIEINKNTWAANIRHYDLDWKAMWGIPYKVFDVISSIGDWKQCWEWVNDYLQKMWGRRVFWNSWEDKLSKVQTKTPIEWWIAIWNPAKPGDKNREYWHVGIVTWVSPDWQTVYITDWNADWKSEKKTENRAVPLSSITSEGWFYVPDFLKNNVYNTTTTKSGKVKTDTSWWSSYDWKSTDSWFSSQAIAYAEDLGRGKIKLWNIPTKIRDEVQEAKKYLEKKWEFLVKENDSQALDIKWKIDLISSMLAKDSDLNSLAWTWQMDYWFDQAKNDLKNDFDSLLSSSVLDNLIQAKADGATFGALSDAELKMLQSSTGRLAAWFDKDPKTHRIKGYNGSEEQMKEALRDLQNKYKRMYKNMTWKEFWADLDNWKF